MPKIKRGRPQKLNRSERVIALRVTIDEMDKIADAANRTGLPIAVFARMAALERASIAALATR